MANHESLFRKVPPWPTVLKVLAMLKISTYFPTTFQQSDIQLGESIPAAAELEPYYIPCKAKRFLEFTDVKRWVTIFRHILSPYGYVIESKETTRVGKKAIFYTIKYKIDTDGYLKQPVNLDFS